MYIHILWKFGKAARALVFDDTGSPRLLEEILGVTADQGFIEFIVKFKYLLQERLVRAERLKNLVPQKVIAFYEKHIKMFGLEIFILYKIIKKIN